jgi:hypothetical protein
MTTGKRLYVQNAVVRSTKQCTHKTFCDSKFYLESDFAKKYNHCMLCAIEAWNGPMPQDEIAACLGIARMRVCQLEKKILEKLRKRINFRNKALKELVDSCSVEINGLAKNEDREVIKSIVSKIACDFDIIGSIKIQFTNKDLKLSDKIGQAIYETENQHHRITINNSTVKNKKEFIRIIVHELFHAVQAENDDETLSEKMCEAVQEEFSPKYYKYLMKCSKQTKRNNMIGVKK